MLNLGILKKDASMKSKINNSQFLLNTDRLNNDSRLEGGMDYQNIQNITKNILKKCNVFRDKNYKAYNRDQL